MPTIVTGAGGFVGAALLLQLAEPPTVLHLAAADWLERVEGTRFAGAVVIHLAARVHARGDADRLHDRDNRQKTAALARAAAHGGARRFVFLSSVKAMGEETAGAPYTPQTPPEPRDAYGRSKLAAERELQQIASGSALEHVIVRAPLVLGAGAKGNAAALVRACDSPWPLPFGAVRNRRSFVHVGDLARLLVACGERPAAAGRTYLAAHREPFSTPGLVATVRAALGRPARLWDIEPRRLEAMARLMGRGESMRRLTRSLEVDPSAAERDLDWLASVPLAGAVDEMVASYRAERGR